MSFFDCITTSAKIDILVLSRMPKGIYVLLLRDANGKTYEKDSIVKYR